MRADAIVSHAGFCSLYPFTHCEESYSLRVAVLYDKQQRGGGGLESQAGSVPVAVSARLFAAGRAPLNLSLLKDAKLTLTYVHLDGQQVRVYMYITSSSP